MLKTAKKEPFALWYGAAANEQWRRLSAAALECVETVSWERLAPLGMDSCTTMLMRRLLFSPLLLSSPPLLAQAMLALAHRLSARHSNRILRVVADGVPKCMAPEPELEGIPLLSVAHRLSVAAASANAGDALLRCVTCELRSRACVLSRRLLGRTENLWC